MRRVLVLSRREPDALQLRHLAEQGFEPVVITEDHLRLLAPEPAPPGVVHRRLVRFLPVSSRWQDWWISNVLESARRTNADFDVVLAELSSPGTFRAARLIAAIYARPLIAYFPDPIAGRNWRPLRRTLGLATAIVAGSQAVRDSLGDTHGKPLLVLDNPGMTLGTFLEEVVPHRPAAAPTDNGTRRGDRPRASVVVPVRDGAQYLPGLLAALDRQTLDKSEFEVVIADDGSSDGLLDGISYDKEQVRVFSAPPATEFAARNRGVGEARADAIAFCDVDCIPAPDWLEHGLAALAHADVAVGAVRFTVPQQRTLWTVLDVETTKNQKQHLLIGNAETVSLFVRREMFERVGGFKTSFIYFSDFAFVRSCFAAGARVAFAGDAVVEHPTRNHVRHFMKKLVRAGTAYGEHQAAEGHSLNAFNVAPWLPVFPLRRWRRQSGLPAGLNEAWFEEQGIHLTHRERVLGTIGLYSLIPYTTLAAQVLGWTRRRLRMQV